MDASHPAQEGGVKALRAHAQPVDADRTQLIEVTIFQCAGVGFECDLGVGVHRKCGTRGGEDVGYLLGCEQAGRAAAEEDGAAAAGLTTWQTRLRTGEAYFVNQGRYIPLA